MVPFVKLEFDATGRSTHPGCPDIVSLVVATAHKWLYNLTPPTTAFRPEEHLQRLLPYDVSSAHCMVWPLLHAYHRLHSSTLPQSAPGGGGSLMQTHLPLLHPYCALVSPPPHAPLHWLSDVQESPAPRPVGSGGDAASVLEAAAPASPGYHWSSSDATEAKTERV